MPNKVNLNRASVEEIANNIEGVGRETAEAIVNYRENNGPIRNADDLREIHDIDDTMSRKIKEGADF